MANPDLHRLLTDLHQQLLEARSVDPKDQALLRHLAEDIRALTKARPTEPPEYAIVRQRLMDGVSAFEASHPQLSQALANVIDTLALYNI
ncbi:MAG TPA: DUF4404 family protein [Gemmatimonadales bacterium]|nr:DUF4404 family protein [Gemmatimonadales bacterium]